MDMGFMLALRSRILGNKNLVRDLIGMLLALAAGISGQLILSDPLKVLAPELPMLSLQDWPGSQFTVELQIIGGGAWQEERGFLQSIVLMSNKTPVAEATQTMTWYADLTQAGAAWHQHRSEPYYDFPIVATSAGEDKPESLLFCSPPDPDTSRECGYRAHWKHWYTQVTFTSRSIDDLPPSEMQKLTDRIDQLMMSAPDKPCMWIFCAGRGEAGKESRQ
jgi:hypothetical protein